ncbi:TetR family transcriptional regulator [Actinomycetospora straminea]|uniref:TetR family transcriptional regulator n=1 Tax=Actinomycetospora straminea TaxID=663607 RepID=A0ABP9E133_9PSEU
MKHTAGVTGNGSARQQELLEAAYAWVLEHGWAGMSLRPLAEAIGSSPRVLLFLFGSKDGLVRALLARSRTDQLAVVDAVGEGGELAEVGARVWAWLAAPEHRALLRLWLEAYTHSVTDAGDGPWAGFAARTVADWDALLAAHQAVDDPAQRVLLLAVLRGALLDLLATGDAERLDAAVAAHLATL